MQLRKNCIQSSSAKRKLVIATIMIIGSMISSIRCTSSFTLNKFSNGRHLSSSKTSLSLILSTAGILPGVSSSSPLSSSSSNLRTNVFRRHAKANNGDVGDPTKSFSNNSSHSMSSAAAISLTGAAAAVITTENNSTSCAEDENIETTSTNVFPEDVLRHDTYNGVTVYVSKLSSEYMTNDADKFTSTLKDQLQSWQLNEKRGIWIHIPTEHSVIVPKCVELGFEFQHAKNGLLVMTRWLPKNQESRLPHGPTHQLGVGIILIHPITKKMLVVQELTGPAAARKLWKMPTGLTDPGEDIVEAAVREAKEETGLDCVFDKIICMRQAHGGIFNQSDMFVVCQMKLSPKYDELLKGNKEIELVPQEEEIAMAKWMEVDEFAGQDLWQDSPLYKELNDSIYHARRSSESSNEDTSDSKSSNDSPRFGMIAKTLPVGFRPGENTIYLSAL